MDPTNYIFVDYENVRGQPMDFNLLVGKRVEVIFFFGKRQNDVPVELVQAMLKFAGRFRLEKLVVEGKNALDFVIAYHVGKAAAIDPSGAFYVFSKDTDYDPLMAQLQAQHIKCARVAVFAETPCFAQPKPAPKPIPKGVAASPSQPVAERVSVLVEHFSKQPRTRPKREKTLRSFIGSMFGKRLSEDEISATIALLKAKDIIAISELGVVEWKGLL